MASTVSRRAVLGSGADRWDRSRARSSRSSRSCRGDRDSVASGHHSSRRARVTAIYPSAPRRRRAALPWKPTRNMRLLPLTQCPRTSKAPVSPTPPRTDSPPGRGVAVPPRTRRTTASQNDIPRSLGRPAAPVRAPWTARSPRTRARAPRHPSRPGGGGRPMRRRPLAGTPGELSSPIVHS
jgi:hypothetical protein